MTNIESVAYARRHDGVLCHLHISSRAFPLVTFPYIYESDHAWADIGSFHQKSPVDPATEPEFIQSYMVCREFCADDFGNKFFRNKLYFREDRGQIQKVHFSFLK